MQDESSQKTCAEFVNALDEGALADKGVLSDRTSEAVARWFHEHADAVYSFIFFRVDRRPEMAEDLVHDTFAWALENLDRYDPGRGPIRVWLLFVARNMLRRTSRRLSRTVPFEEISDERFELGDRPLPPEVLERRETVDRVCMTLAASA